MVHCIYYGVVGDNFQKYCISFSKIKFVLTNSVGPDEMPHYAAFHLGLHCLPKYLRGFLSPKELKSLFTNACAAV